MLKTEGPLCVCGSPPRAWGQRSDGNKFPCRHRFTPTGVGTTRAFACPACPACGSPPRAWGQLKKYPLSRNWPTVHPHGRGDNSTGPSIPSGPDRFTPTGVGTTHGAVVFAVNCYRFTPTGVGTTPAPPARVNPCCGSPPRAWGQRRLASQQTDVLRFTPTGVGTTKCGACRPTNNTGSPPRAWGQR